MSDMVRSAIDNVIISLEPGDHQFSVPPMVANYIGQLQRENARLRAVVARGRVGEATVQEVFIGESSK